jgi:hypothetical protein
LGGRVCVCVCVVVVGWDRKVDRDRDSLESATGTER